MVRPLALLAAAGLSGLASQASAENPLASYRWTSRVLVIAAPDTGDRRFKVQAQEARAARADFTERDLVVVEAVGDTVEARSLRRQLGLDRQSFRAVLIGKDGEAKLSEGEPIPAARLFAIIDAMPMRQDEQRRR